MLEQNYDYARITICLTDGIESGHTVYEQTIPLTIVGKRDPQWVQKVIALIDGLETKNV